jgi:chemotaxis receptor (MCP) glutamine deamidase CheD
VPALFHAAYQLNAEKHRVQICVAGGAQFLDKGGIFNIGQRNYERFLALMAEHRLVLRAEAAGGLVSRTIELSIKTGQVRLKTSGQTGTAVLFEGSP